MSDYPKGVFKYADDDTPFDEGWLEFLEDFVSRYVPPVLEGRVEEEEIVRRADGKLLQSRAYFDFGNKVDWYIGVNNWGAFLHRKKRSRRRWAPYAGEEASAERVVKD
jgi:hypothetical protein